jgi:hypothetical protein
VSVRVPPRVSLTGLPGDRKRVHLRVKIREEGSPGELRAVGYADDRSTDASLCHLGSAKSECARCISEVQRLGCPGAPSGRM